MTDNTPEHFPSATERELPAHGGTNSQNNSGRNTARRNQDSRGTNMVTVHKSFESHTPDLNGVLGLRTEKVDKKVTFEAFCEKLDTYIMRGVKNGEDVVLVTRGKNIDPLVVFNNENILDKLTTEEQRSDVAKYIKKEEIKEFVRERKLRP